MYLNLQIGNFNVVLGKNKMLKKPAPRPGSGPRRVPVTYIAQSGNVVEQEFIIDDESKLRYRN